MRGRLFILFLGLLGIIALFLAPLKGGIGGRLDLAPDVPLEGSFIPDQILIGLQDGATGMSGPYQVSVGRFGVASLDRLNQKHAVRQVSAMFAELDTHDGVAKKHGLGDIYKLTFEPGTDIFAAIAEYQLDPAVAYAEPNRIYRASEIPNDVDFYKQWALHNTGQTGGSLDADIDAPEAWNIQKGQPSITIAIVDTGVDYNHPDLSGGRIRTDIDKDFINNDNDAMDDHGHGTYCSGIAAANMGNTAGIAGICPGCKILPVKVLDSGGSGSAESVSQGIQYAAQSGAQIISMSLGYASECGCSQTVARTINYAFEKGSLLVAASGNDGTKTALSYPASSPRVMSVGASDHKDLEADFSNRSPRLDIMAPGKDIYSLERGGVYRTASGTSAAAPHVSGVAGLVWSARPALTNVQVWWVLYQSADNFYVTGSVSSELLPTSMDGSGLLSATPRVYLPFTSRMRVNLGRLNAYNALRISFIGQVSAPEDTCSDEPDCPPGCGAEITLSGDDMALSDLRLLRLYRDEVLSKTEKGRRWIDLYQRNRLESAWILASNADLRTQTRQALAGWMPLFEALVFPDSIPSGQALLSSQQAEALELVISSIAAHGSPQLVSDLAQVQAEIEIRRFIGWDIRDAWEALNK